MAQKPEKEIPEKRKRRLSIFDGNKKGIGTVGLVKPKDEKTGEYKQTGRPASERFDFDTINNKVIIPSTNSGTEKHDSTETTTRGDSTSREKRGSRIFRSSIQIESPKRVKSPLLVCLPNGSFEFISWEKDGNKTIETIYKEVCIRDNVPIMQVYVHQTKKEILIGTLLKDLPEDITKITLLLEDSNTPEKEVGETEPFHYTLPNAHSGQRYLPVDELLGEAFEKIVVQKGYPDGLKLDEFVFKDAISGAKLSIYKPISEVIKEMTPDLASSSKVYKIMIQMMTDSFFHVCLPVDHPNHRSVPFQSVLTVKQVIKKTLFIVNNQVSRPDLQTTLKVYDEQGDVVDQELTLPQLNTKVIYYGILPKDWKKRHGDVNFSKASMFKEILFFLPGGIIHKTPLVQVHTKKTGEVVDAVCRLYNHSTTEPHKDVNGNVIDVQARFGEIKFEPVASQTKAGVHMDYVFQIFVGGVDLRTWTLQVFSDKLLNNQQLMENSCKLSTYCRNHDDGVRKEGVNPTYFRVYLPFGQISSNHFDPTKPIRDVLNRLKDTRDELKDSSFVPTSIKGDEIPPSMTEQEIEGSEVCYGTDILEWVLYNIMNEKATTKTQTKTKIIPNADRVKFVVPLLMKWESIQSGNALIEASIFETKSGGLLSDETDNKAKNENIQKWNNTSYWYLENKEYDDGYLANKFKQDEAYYEWTHSCPFRFLKETTKNPTEKTIVDDFSAEEEIRIDEDGFQAWSTELEKKIEKLYNQ